MTTTSSAAPGKNRTAVTTPRFSLPLLVLMAWTVLVWAGRVRNIIADDELSDGGRRWRLALAASFLVLAGLAAASGFQRTRRTVPAWAPTALAIFTLVVWPIRAMQILAGEWDAGFKAVHTVLAVVSVGLSLWVLRRLRSSDSGVG